MPDSKGVAPRGNGGSVIHAKPEFDSVPTPDWFLRTYEGWHDPFPLGGEMIPPPPRSKVFANPGYSQKLEMADVFISWHRDLGCYVHLLVPIETSTQFAKRMIQYGCERLYFARRIFPSCRGVELLILTGDNL